MRFGAKKSSKILLIDDDQIYRDLLGNALQREEVVVLRVSDTLAALTLFENDSDILHVIVDLRMPLNKPNGISFARMAKFKRWATRFVLISGEPELLAVEDATEFGGVLAKDDGLPALVSKIRQRLDLPA